MEVGFIILLFIAIPIVIIWPLLIWVGVLVSMYKLAKEKVWTGK